MGFDSRCCKYQWDQILKNIFRDLLVECHIWEPLSNDHKIIGSISAATERDKILRYRMFIDLLEG